MALQQRQLNSNAVRVPDPEPGQVAVIARYGKERAMLLHPVDFHRFEEMERLLNDAVELDPIEFSDEAVRAHREEDTPGAALTDANVLAVLFG